MSYDGVHLGLHATLLLAVIECVLFQNLTNLDRFERNRSLFSLICSDTSEKIWLSHVARPSVVCGALRRREPDDHAHYDQKDLCVLFHQTGSISSDKSRSIQIDLDLSDFEKERNRYSQTVELEYTYSGQLKVYITQFGAGFKILFHH